MTLILALLLAAPVRAADDALGRLQKEHARLTEAAKAKLLEVRTERESYPQAPDKDAALVRWELHIVELEDLSKRSNTLRVDHRKMIKTLVGAAFSRTIGRVVGRTYKPDQGAAKLFIDDSAGEEMKLRDLQMTSDIRVEVEAFERARATRREEIRRRELVLKSLAGLALFLLLLVAIIAPWRKAPAPGEAAPQEPPPGRFLLGGDFEVGALIGRGAMGEVFSAVDKTLNRRVALKRMRPELLAEPKDRERFLSEARLVAGLKHPNIVAIHSVAQEGDDTYLVFEFVEGETLEALLRNGGPLPWAEALRHLRGICGALECAHLNGVIHRDLKPANIMAAADGTLKVMDFGIAHQARASASRMTRGTSLGTPPYMAPEQELGGVSASVDLYAAAVCFYEMLTGRLPFSGPNFLAQKREELYAPASSLARGLPPGIDAFFKTALSAQPSSRPKDAAALYRAAAECAPT